MRDRMRARALDQTRERTGARTGARLLASLTAVTLALCVLLRSGVAATESITSDPRIAAPVASVDSVGMTVSDMTRAIDFYTRVLPFMKEFDIEVAGRSWEPVSYTHLTLPTIYSV